MGLTTFPKPPGLKYTDMAIYIDAHIPDIIVPGQNVDIETKVYQYLYHIYFALSCKAHYFKNMSDYDGYALYAASQTYLTIRDRWQHQGEWRGDKQVAPIKSSLNYIKKLLYPFKVNYQQAEFMMILNPEENSKQETEEVSQDLRDSIQADYNWGLSEALDECFEAIPRTIKKVLKTTPYRRDRLMMQRLYISCLLSLSSNITLSKSAVNTINRSVDENIALIKQLDLNGRRPESIVLWHLNKVYNDYVKVLIARIKRELDKEIADTRASFELSESTIDDILNSAYATYDTQNEPGEY